MTALLSRYPPKHLEPAGNDEYKDNDDKYEGC